MDHQNCVEKFPVINLNAKENWSTERWSSTCNDVRKALEEHGCFMVVYDEIPLELRDSLFSVADKLFDLPTETKVKNTSNTPFFGYFGVSPILPLHESMGIEDVTAPEAIQSFCELMWPDTDDHEDFCGIIQRYAKLAYTLEEMVIRMVFESYGLGKLCESHVDSTNFVLRFNSYRVPTAKETTMVGVKAHTDKSFITILDQNQVGGLEVKLKDEQWHAVDFRPSSFIVLAGEGLMAWSNNRIQPPVHQVTMNNGKMRTRYSMGLFSFHKGIIEIPEELIDEEQYPRCFHSFDHLGLLHFFAAQFQTAGGFKQCTIHTYCGV